MAHYTAKLKIHFESVGGYVAEITGDEAAIRALEEILVQAGAKLDETEGTWFERGARR